MNNNCIHSIDLIFNNNSTLSISSDDFDNLYIANINDEGDEISYTFFKNKKNLYANFFMIKLLENGINENKKNINRLYEQKDIIKVGLKFTNGSIQEFELPKKRTVNNGLIENKYQTSFYNNNDLCIIVCDKKIRYMENLFA